MEINRTNSLLGQKKVDIKIKENEQKILSEKITNLENQEMSLINNCQKQINEAEKEKDEIEKKTLGQFIKIYLLINEIKKIQMNKKSMISFENEFESIITNRDFIQKTNLVEMIKKKIEKVITDLKNNETIVLKNFGINKNNLLQIKEPDDDQHNIGQKLMK